MQAGVVAEVARNLRLGERLRGTPGKARDHHRWGLGRFPGPVARGAHRELQHRPVESDIADRELGGVNADREPAGPGIEIIAAERALAAHVELPPGVERERVSRNDRAAPERGKNIGRPVGPAQSHNSLSNSAPCAAR